jgi:hypothetical protein
VENCETKNNKKDEAQVGTLIPPLRNQLTKLIKIMVAPRKIAGESDNSANREV